MLPTYDHAQRETLRRNEAELAETTDSAKRAEIEEDSAIVCETLGRLLAAAKFAEHLAAAKRWLGADAPLDVLAAKTRTTAWRPFAAHTDEERAQHVADVALVDAYEASRPQPYMGADPMGDE